MNNLALVEKRTINNVLVEGYYGDKDAWFSREQIGSALGYSHPGIAIGKIHNKHKNRLDKFSTLTKTVNVDGKERGSYVYCLRGVLEICRWSKQPVADMVMDKLYDMAMSVIDKGYYSAIPDMDLLNLLASKCIDNPKLYNQLNKNFIGSIAKMQLKEEKDEAKWIIKEYNRKCKNLNDYYNKHLGEKGFKEQFEQLSKQADAEIAEKCPHLNVYGLNIHFIETKSGIKV